MKIVTFLGSPHKRGNTAKIIDWIAEEVTAQGHEFERIDIVNHAVHGCIGCYKCQEASDTLGCAFTDVDDGDMLWHKVIDADLALIATPLYAWSYTGQIKPFLDRGMALVKVVGREDRKSLIAGKPLGLVVTCFDEIKDNADLMEPLHQRYVDFTAAENAGVLIITGATVPDAMGEKEHKAAVEFARKLVGA